MTLPPQEIEHRFLVASDAWREAAGPPVLLRQGYLSVHPERTVRVRVEGDRGKLTIKGKKVRAASPEFEYDIPLAHAERMLETMARRPPVEKHRYEVLHDGMVWHVDEFLGSNAGLVIAEVELEREDQPWSRPPWVGREVTADRRYSNSNLSERPFRTWDEGGGDSGRQLRRTRA